MGVDVKIVSKLALQLTAPKAQTELVRSFAGVKSLNLAQLALLRKALHQQGLLRLPRPLVQGLLQSDLAQPRRGQGSLNLSGMLIFPINPRSCLGHPKMLPKPPILMR